MQIEEAKAKMKKRITRTKFKRRLRTKRRNAKIVGREFISGGGRRKVTPKMRRARMKAGRKLARKSKKYRRKILLTKKKRSSWYKESATGHSLQFVGLVNEVAANCGNPDFALDLLETFDPKLTNSPIGDFALTVSEKVEENANVGGLLADVMILDSNTIGLFFETADNVNEDAFKKVLKEHGEVVTVAKPGDAIDETSQSDLYMFAITVPENKLEDVAESEDDESDELDLTEVFEDASVLEYAESID